MEDAIKILILEDNMNDADLLQRELKKSGLNFTFELVETREGFENALDHYKPDIILSDYVLPSFDGITAFHIKQKKYPHLPFIIISGTIGEEKAVGLIKEGLTDYALKDKLFSVPDKVKRAIREAAENQKKILAEQKLIQSERQLARAQEIAHIGNWEIDLATGIINSSDEACRIFGVETDQRNNLYEIWLSHVHPEDIEFVMEKIKESQDLLRDSSFYHRIVRQDGAIRHLYVERKFEFDATGKAIRRFGIVQDVTEIKEAEKMLRKSEENLRAIFDSTDTGFLLLDTNFNIRSFNKQVNLFAEKSFGFPLREHANLIEMLMPERRGDFTDLFNKVLKKEHISYETNDPQTNGEMIWYNIKGNPVLSQDGHVTGICLAVDDISARKRSEEQVRELYERFNSATQAANEIIWDWKLNEEIIWWNEKYYQMMEVKKSEEWLPETTWINHIHGEDKEAVLTSIHKFLASKEDYWKGEYRFVNDKGKTFYLNDRGYVLRDKDGIPYRMTGAASDITEVKKREENLFNTNKELQKINAELDRFVYSASHDLRAPLKSLLGLINIIKGSTEPGNQAQHERLEMMNKSILKLDHFIQDILHYSHNSRAEVSKNEIQFEEMIQEIRNSLKFMEGTKELTLQVEIYQNEKFISDKRRVTVILNNLISNAIKYKDTSKDHSFVSIFIECTHEHAIIKIEDNGIGIADKDQEKIFEMFYRATTLSTGSGLGMYIVKETLEKIGATLHLESELDKGTKFTVRIPNLQAT